RMATLARLARPDAGNRPAVVLTSVNAALQRVPARSMVASQSFSAAPGNVLRMDDVMRWLELNGFLRGSTVREPGEYAVRGGILDLFAPGMDVPVRLDFFGDTLESIRSFDPETQRTSGQLRKLDLVAVAEFQLTPETIARFRKEYLAHFGAARRDDLLYEAVSEGRRHPGMEHWVPLFHERLETLLDYLPGASVSLDHQADEVLAARLEMIADHYAARRMVPRDGEVPYRPLPPERLYLDQAGWDAMLAGGPRFAFSPFEKPDGAVGVEGGGRSGPVFFQASGPGINVFEQLRGQTERWNNDRKRIVIAAWTRGSRERLANLLREHGFK